MVQEVDEVNQIGQLNEIPENDPYEQEYPPTEDEPDTKIDLETEGATRNSPDKVGGPLSSDQLGAEKASKGS